MSEDDNLSPEKEDGLECFQFTLLLDDVSSSNHKNRKASAHEATEEYFREFENSMKGKNGKKNMPFGERFEAMGKQPTGHYREKLKSCWVEPPVGLGEDALSINETRSECREPRRSFNIWGGHKFDGEGGIGAHFSSKLGVASRLPMEFHSDFKAVRKTTDAILDESDSNPETPKKKKSLRGSKNEAFYPKESNYRKLSYQETCIKKHERQDDPIDLRARLNLDVLGLYSPSTKSVPGKKFAQYVHNDLPQLFRDLGDEVEKHLKHLQESDFPSLTTALCDR